TKTLLIPDDAYDIIKDCRTLMQEHEAINPFPDTKQNKTIEKHSFPPYKSGLTVDANSNWADQELSEEEKNKLDAVQMLKLVKWRTRSPAAVLMIYLGTVVQTTDNGWGKGLQGHLQPDNTSAQVRSFKQVRSFDFQKIVFLETSEEILQLIPE